MPVPAPIPAPEPDPDPPRPRRRTPEAVWAEVRKAWEGGETARSVARRYGVGVPALWKRREAEAWTRPDPSGQPIEPAEGWDSHVQDRLSAFLADLETQRELALALMAALEGGRPDDLAAWHLGFYFRWRAGRLGPEVARADFQRLAERPWAGAVWEANGRLKAARTSDLALIRLYREDWRRLLGLPDGAAPNLP